MLPSIPILKTFKIKIVKENMQYMKVEQHFLGDGQRQEGKAVRHNGGKFEKITMIHVYENSIIHAFIW